MKIFFIGLLIFFIALGIHLVIWRVHKPKGQIRALLQLFFGTFLIYLVGGCSGMNLYEYIQLGIFFTALVLVYTVTYSAIEVDSPSLLIVLNISGAGSSGLDDRRLKEIMTDEILVKPRMLDLIEDRMVDLEGGKYKLTAAGRFFSGIFIFYRSLLGLPKGG